MTTAHACLDRIACLGTGIKYHPHQVSQASSFTLSCSKTTSLCSLRAILWNAEPAQVRKDNESPCKNYARSCKTMLALEQLSPMRAQVTRQLGNQLRFSCASLGLHLPLLPYPCPYTSILHLRTVLALGIIAPSLWASLSQRSALAPLCHCAARPCPPILWAYFHDARMLL